METTLATLFTLIPLVGDIDSNQLSLVKGDAYDGVANDVLTWTADADVNGLTGRLTFRQQSDFTSGSAELEVTGTGVGMLMPFSITSAQTNTIPIVNANSVTLNYDVEVEFATGSYRTVAQGTASFQIAQTRR